MASLPFKLTDSQRRSNLKHLHISGQRNLASFSSQVICLTEELSPLYISPQVQCFAPPGIVLGSGETAFLSPPLHTTGFIISSCSLPSLQKFFFSFMPQNITFSCLAVFRKHCGYLDWKTRIIH